MGSVMPTGYLPSAGVSQGLTLSTGMGTVQPSLSTAHELTGVSQRSRAQQAGHSSQNLLDQSLGLKDCRHAHQGSCFEGFLSQGTCQVIRVAPVPETTMGFR